MNSSYFLLFRLNIGFRLINEKIKKNLSVVEPLLRTETKIMKLREELIGESMKNKPYLADHAVVILVRQYLSIRKIRFGLIKSWPNFSDVQSLKIAKIPTSRQAEFPIREKFGK